ncbi:spherulation-specific family 4 protein [Tautonia sp. JC769]|uniref:spherulation-specific family 4 protein n=1 Tax=Tautonia sp. JC769 TaxID=3232135 RepID=UPI003457E6F7
MRRSKCGLADLARALVPLAVAVLLTNTYLPPAGAQSTSRVRALVPAYFYPTWWQGSPWDDLNQAASQIPIEAIMNPASGPGHVQNPDYVRAVTDLRAAGGKVIGYVSTGFGSRPMRDVVAEIRAYLSWYDVDGIFLDEMGNQAGPLDYESLYCYIKLSQFVVGRELRVVGNVGIPFAPAQGYLRSADTLVIFEGPQASPGLVIDFEEILVPPGGAFYPGIYQDPSQEFQLTAIAPPDGFLSSFYAPGTDAFGFYAGSNAIGASTEATITLTRRDLQPFTMRSIDVARYFLFNAANDPVTLTFTGQQVGGGTVQQSFTVQSPVGVPEFDTFTFSGFSNLVSVSWQQEFGPAGVKHQFDNISLEPEPLGANFDAYPAERPYDGLIPWFLQYRPRRIANLVYDVPTADAMEAALEKAIRNNAGYVYLTDDVLSNPWDTLPAYWEEQVEAIRAFNASP